MGEIKAIETEYNGYKFRSRLEARWAVFFDAMGIKYLYEHEGLERDSVKYLPDFYLPECGLYAEVKGCSSLMGIPKKDVEKMGWMIDFDGPCSDGIILLGNIPEPNAIFIDWLIWYWNGEGTSIGYLTGMASDKPQKIDCDYRDNPFDEFARYGCTPDWSNDDHVLTTTTTLDELPVGYHENQKLNYAITQARKARFEHGEKPIIIPF